ncbi:DUF433 domain-containing protein, partial [Microcoleus sp. AT3-D2]|uniref:DUF433 domain-containing protein n=1 Tax=Microcoleus sp. AT3-D2 TaxID=2818612 RepID=UPI002FD31501
MKQNDDRAFPEITYVRGASGQLIPVLRDTRLRVQTVVIAAQKWGFPPNQIAAEYDLSEAQVNDVLAFYAAHSQEIDASIDQGYFVLDSRQGLGLEFRSRIHPNL